MGAKVREKEPYSLPHSFLYIGLEEHIFQGWGKKTAGGWQESGSLDISHSQTGVHSLLGQLWFSKGFAGHRGLST